MKPGDLVYVNMANLNPVNVFKYRSRDGGDLGEVCIILDFFTHPFYHSDMVRLLGPSGIREINRNWIKEIQ